MKRRMSASDRRQADERWLAYSIIGVALAIPLACLLGYLL